MVERSVEIAVLRVFLKELFEERRRCGSRPSSFQVIHIISVKLPQ